MQENRCYRERHDARGDLVVQHVASSKILLRRKAIGIAKAPRWSKDKRKQKVGGNQPSSEETEHGDQRGQLQIGQPHDGVPGREPRRLITDKLRS